MSVKIIVDSTADLLPSIRSRVEVVPLTVHFGDTEYLDGVTITHRAFYEKLIECDTLPSTSQPTPAAFEEMYAKITAQGDSAVVITISAKLSGTFQSASIAAAEFENIYIVDSGTTAIGGCSCWTAGWMPRPLPGNWSRIGRISGSSPCWIPWNI